MHEQTRPAVALERTLVATPTKKTIPGQRLSAIQRCWEAIVMEVTVSWRARLTRLFIWITVLAWGILLGGKLFDLRVLVGAWSANPPESLNLLPYGPRFPVDTGDYFFPSSVALLVCSFGALIAGWNTPRSFRVLLAIPAMMLLVTLIFTVLWFWPANAALWAVAIDAPNAIRDRAEVIRLVRQWVNYDWLRVTVGMVGFVSSIRAISVPFPAPPDSPVTQDGR